MTRRCPPEAIPPHAKQLCSFKHNEKIIPLDRSCARCFSQPIEFTYKCPGSVPLTFYILSVSFPSPFSADAVRSKYPSWVYHDSSFQFICVLLRQCLMNERLGACGHSRLGVLKEAA